MYPRRGKQKANTKVQDVFYWQNFGTDTIKAAEFLQAAESRNRGWAVLIGSSVFDFLFSNNIAALKMLGQKVASDINKATNRIDTRRLMHSQRGDVE